MNFGSKAQQRPNIKVFNPLEPGKIGVNSNKLITLNLQPFGIVQADPPGPAFQLAPFGGPLAGGFLNDGVNPRFDIPLALVHTESGI